VNDDYSAPYSSHETEHEASIRNAGWQRGVSDERARCCRRLSELQWELSERDAAVIGKAIVALQEEA
jgi:hypothetical protein